MIFSIALNFKLDLVERLELSDLPCHEVLSAFNLHTFTIALSENAWCYHMKFPIVKMVLILRPMVVGQPDAF